jgi:hypothetical protein
MNLPAEQTIVGKGWNDAHELLIGEFIERSVFQPDFGFAKGIELTFSERLREAKPLFRFDARPVVRGRWIEGDEITCGRAALRLDRHRTLNQFTGHGDGELAKGEMLIIDPSVRK